MQYVRCSFCDSAFNIEEMELEMLDKLRNIQHGFCTFNCPACGLAGKSFIFEDKI